MSYKTLHLDIVQDIQYAIDNNKLDNYPAAVDRWIQESVCGSEVTFKPLAAKKFLEAHKEPIGHDDMAYAAEVLERLIRDELSELGIDC